jgi:hypothetical protein
MYIAVVLYLPRQSSNEGGFNLFNNIQAFLLLTQPCQCAVLVRLETTVEGLLLELGKPW